MMDNRPSWFVSVFSDGGEEQTSCFIKEGFWENLYLDESANLINEIKIGDRIALKTTPNKKTRSRLIPMEKLFQLWRLRPLELWLGTIMMAKESGK